MFIILKLQQQINNRVKLCCRALEANSLIILETDTIIGISCLIKINPIKALYRVKRRDANKPFIIAAKYIEHMLPYINLGYISEEDFKLINSITEEPTTYLVPVNINSYLASFSDQIAIRLIRKGIIADVTEYLNQPVITTSCNLQGQKPITQPLLAVQEVSRSLVLCGPYPPQDNDKQPSKIYDLRTKTWLR